MDFVDLKTQYQVYRTEIHEAMETVLTSAAFINGPALLAFEDELRLHSGASHAIGCSSGTDALILGMLAMGLKAGDQVLIPDFTFYATAETVMLLGATPVFVDIEPDSYNINPAKIAERITPRTVGIIPVSLYGQCADMDAVNRIASEHGLWVLEDGAQSYGAEYHARKSCTLSPIAATSFFPAKPLGCYGDGGAVFASDDEVAKRVRVLLNHGQEKRYIHGTVGINGRLDALQAAILSVKLRHFDDEVVARRRVASWYDSALQGQVRTPIVLDGRTSVWAQYTVRVDRRDEVRSRMTEKDIPTAVHYPLPLHQQKALAGLNGVDTDFPEACKASAEVLSLPMHPFMTEEQAEAVSTALLDATSG